MSKKTKVVRYNEEQFISLLESIVKRVKREQFLEESRKQTRTIREGSRQPKDRK